MFVRRVGLMSAQRPQSTSHSNSIIIIPFKEDPQSVGQWAHGSLILGVVPLTLRRAPLPHYSTPGSAASHQRRSARRDEQRGEGTLGSHPPAEGSPVAAGTIDRITAPADEKEKGER